jgi:hypothetical protein
MTLIIDPFRLFASAASYDSDAETLFTNRAAAGDVVPTGYRQAISDCLVSIKAVSGLWNGITQLAILAGATTIAGAVLSIKGSNLINVSHVDADVNLKTGVKGDGSTKYFQTGYTGTVAGTSMNNFHTYGYYTEAPTTNAAALFGQGGSTTIGGTMILYGTGANVTNFKSRNVTANPVTGNTGVGGYGTNRTNGTNYEAMRPGTTSTITSASSAAPARRIHLLARTSNSTDTPDSFCNARVLVWAMGAGITTLGGYSTPIANLVAALNAL